MPDGDAESSVLFKEVVFEEPMTNAPAQKQPIRTIGACHTVPNDGTLRPAARMQAQRRIVLGHARSNRDIIGLLKADAVAIVASHGTAPDDRAKAPVQEDPAASTSVEMNRGISIAINDQVFDAHAFKIIPAHHREHRGSLGVPADQAVGHDGLVDRKGVSIPAGDARHCGMKSACTVIPDGHTPAHGKARRVCHGKLLFAKITVHGQGGDAAGSLLQNGLALAPAYHDIRSEMQ